MIITLSILTNYDDISCDSCDYNFRFLFVFTYLKNIKMKHLFSIFIYYKKYKLKTFRLLLKCSVFELATSQLNYIMQTTTGKSKSGIGKSSGIKRRNKKEASEWFQALSRIEQLLVKQEANASSSSKERKSKKEMHERERELILKRQSEHEARMKAQLQSKAKITQQIQKCQEMRRRLIPLQMRLEQMKLHESHKTYQRYTESSFNFYFKLSNLEAKVSNELRLVQNEEKALFDMHHRHHCIKNSIKDIIAKTTALSNSYTRVQAKNYVDDVYNLVTV